MLSQNVQTPRPEIFAIALALVDGIARRRRFEEFETVARHEQRGRRLIETVVGTADALQQARRAFGRAHLDDEVDVAPIDAQIEAGRRHQRPQFTARHRAFDLAPRLL